MLRVRGIVLQQAVALNRRLVCEACVSSTQKASGNVQAYY